MSEKLVVRFSSFFWGDLCLFLSLFFSLSFAGKAREREREGGGHRYVRKTIGMWIVKNTR